MNTIKKVWLTEQGMEIYSLSIESASLVQHEKLSVRSEEFPTNPTPSHPKRHVVNIGLLGYDDLAQLHYAIEQILS